MDLITISDNSYNNNSLSSIKLQNSVNQLGTGFNTTEMPASDIMTISSNTHKRIGNINILENKLNLVIQRTKKLLNPSDDKFNGGTERTLTSKSNGKFNKSDGQHLKKKPILVMEKQQSYPIKKYRNRKYKNNYLISDSIFTLNG